MHFIKLLAYTLPLWGFSLGEDDSKTHCGRCIPATTDDYKVAVKKIEDNTCYKLPICPKTARVVKHGDTHIKVCRRNHEMGKFSIDGSAIKIRLKSIKKQCLNQEGVRNGLCGHSIGQSVQKANCEAGKRGGSNCVPGCGSNDDSSFNVFVN